MAALSDSHARELDSVDHDLPLRNQFFIPTKTQLKRATLSAPSSATNGAANSDEDTPGTYLCGNSLGLQPKLTAKYTAAYHQTWAQKGVYGHFKEIEDSSLPPWLHVDDDVVDEMAKIVGAERDEVAVMQTLTANIHLALATFYRPSKERYKIILESKAFPSDHYAVESQIRHHNLDPADAMVTIEPPTQTDPTLTTSHILSVIEKHAASTAVLLLPGIQFYTGQLLDIPTITAHAQKFGIVVAWDLAHAAGNVALELHKWNVDVAMWCTYKYLNAGPGSIGGFFVHNRHSGAYTPANSEQAAETNTFEYKPRLAGWWGSSKGSRFAMTNRFEPIPGAAGWQLSNPSVADMTAVRASLDIFKQTSMTALSEKSAKLTAYLEELLDKAQSEATTHGQQGLYDIITPRDKAQRGAQLSIKLAPGLLDSVMHVLEENAIVVDERKPDVIRVAPTPLYNTYADCYRFVDVFSKACADAMANKGKANEEHGGSVMVDGGKDAKGWSDIK